MINLSSEDGIDYKRARLFDFTAFLKICFSSVLFGEFYFASMATVLQATAKISTHTRAHQDCRVTASLQLRGPRAMSDDCTLPVSVTLTSEHFHKLTHCAADTDPPVEGRDACSASSGELSHYPTRYLISKGSRWWSLGLARSLQMKSRKQVLLMCCRLAAFAAC